MCKLIKLTTVAVNGHKRRDTITYILMESIPEHVASLINVACFNGSGILLITGCKPFLNLLNRVHLLGEVIQDLIGNILLTRIMEVQGVTDMLPEVLNGLGDILVDITPTAAVVSIPRRHTLQLCLKLLSTALTTIMGDNLLCEIVIISQLRISSLDELPGVGILLHHRNDTVPVVGVDTTQGLTPQMGILMKRQLGINLTKVKMNLTLIGEAIAIALLSLEMAHLTGLTLILLGILQDTTVLTAIRRNRDTHGLQVVNHSAASLTVFSSETTRSNRGLALATLLLLTGLSSKNTLFLIKKSLLLFISSQPPVSSHIQILGLTDHDITIADSIMK